MTFSKASCSFLRIYLIIVSCVAFHCNAADQISTLFVNASHGSGRPIPNTLFGIFFEVHNYYYYYYGANNNKARLKDYGTF